MNMRKTEISTCNQSNSTFKKSIKICLHFELIPIRLIRNQLKVHTLLGFTGLSVFKLGLLLTHLLKLSTHPHAETYGETLKEKQYEL